MAVRHRLSTAGLSSGTKAENGRRQANRFVTDLCFTKASVGLVCGAYRRRQRVSLNRWAELRLDLKRGSCYYSLG